MSAASGFLSAPVHLREGLRILVGRPITALLGVATLALGLVLVALAAWSNGQVGHLQATLDADLRLHAALSPTLDEAQTKAVLEKVATDAAVRSVRWVGPKEQKKHLEAILGADLLEGLDEAVFPVGGMAEIAVTRATVVDADALQAFRTRLESIESIDGIDAFPFDSRHIKVLLDAASVTRLAGLVLGLIALLAAGLVVFLFVQTALSSIATSVEILRAFGATAGFIRARFFFAAGVVGLAGAAVAVAFALVLSGPLSELVSVIPVGADSAAGASEVASGPAGLMLYVWALGGGLVVAMVGCALALSGRAGVKVGSTHEVTRPRSGAES
jgi:cell division protein FtsX